MNRAVKYLDRFIEACLMLFMLAIVLTVTWQVLSRYLLQHPSSGSEELARFTLIWIGMLGAVYCYRTKGHLGIDLLTNKLAEQQQKVVSAICYAAVFVFAVAVMVIGGTKLVMMTFSPVQTSAALGISVGYVYAIVPVSGVFFCCYALFDLFELREKRLELDGVQDGV